MFYYSDISLKLSWLTESRMELKIGRKRRNIWLTPTTNIPDLNTPCLFKGIIEGDPNSVVSVSGCHHSNYTSASIASVLLPSGFTAFEIYDGISRIFDDRSIKNRGGESIDYSVADYLMPPEDPFKIGHVWSGPLPSHVVLKTDIKYDNSLLEHFGNSHEKTEDWINSVVELAKPRMLHDSLSIRVVLEIGEVSHIDETLKATEEIIRYLQRKEIRHLTSYFCKDIGGGVLGIAFVKGACYYDGHAVNINEMYSETSPDQKTARTFAHELGHNLGML